MNQAEPIVKIFKNGKEIEAISLSRELLVGRADDCGIFLDDQAISRNHGILEPGSEGARFTKKSKFSEIFLNGTPVNEAVLREGDELSMGPFILKYFGGIPSIEESPSRPSLKEDHNVAQLKKENLDMGPAESLFSSQLKTESQEGPKENELGSLEELQVSSRSTDDIASISPGLSLEVPEPLELGAENKFESSHFGSSAPLELSLSSESEGGSGFELESAPQSQGISRQEEEPGILSNLELNDFSPIPNPDVLSSEPALGGAEPVSELQSPEESTSMLSPDADTNVVDLDGIEAKLRVTAGEGAGNFYAVSENETFIGRSKECSITIKDRKASRKNSVIVRDGGKFTVRDLESLNGTYVNKERVTFRQLAHGDRIKIGDVEFEFLAEDEDFGRRVERADVGSVPNDLSEDAPFPNFSLDQANASQQAPDEVVPQFDFPQPGEPSGFQQSVPVAPPHLAPQSPPRTQGPVPTHPYDFNSSLPHGMSPQSEILAKYRAIPPGKRILYILAIGVILYLAMDDDVISFFVPKKGASIEKNKKTEQMPTGLQEKKRTFEMLNAEQKLFVESAHRAAFDFYQNKKYDDSLFELQKIFSLVDDYKNSRELQSYALKGRQRLEALKEEQRRKEEQERLQAKIAELSTQISKAMEAKKLDVAKELITELISLDPENELAKNWLAEIKKIQETQKLKSEAAASRKKLLNIAMSILNKGKKQSESENCIAAIKTLKRVKRTGIRNRDLLSSAQGLIKDCENRIAQMRDPVLEEALTHEQNGEVRQAYNLFEKATKIDPRHAAGFEGMVRIRGMLHERAKILYTEAVLAESYSDFEEAEKKYKETLEIAPKGDIYEERAQKKLSQYYFRK